MYVQKQVVHIFVKVLFSMENWPSSYDEENATVSLNPVSLNIF